MSQARKDGVYDATAPIVCPADGDEVAKRIAQVERMRAALDHIDRTEHGLLLRFPNEPVIEADVRRFAVDEKRCCQFWGFDIDTTPDEITLRWDGPPDVAVFLERLHAYFLGGEPISTVTGLL
jgi:hypothetical protein